MHDLTCLIQQERGEFSTLLLAYEQMNKLENVVFY